MNGTIWSETEELFLINSYKQYSADYIAAYLNRTIASVKKKAKRLKYKKTQKIFWTNEEKEILHNCMDKNMTYTEVAYLLGNRTPEQVRFRCEYEKICHRFSNNNFWTKKQEEFLIKYYDIYSVEYISIVIKKTIEATKRKAKRLKLKKPHMIPWTEEEKDVVIRNLSLPIEDLLILLKTKTLNNIRVFIKNYKPKKEKTTKIIVTKNKIIQRDTKIWLQEDDEIIIKSHLKISNSELSKMLNVTNSQLSRRIRFLGLQSRTPYSDHEIEFLKNNCKTLELAEICDKLNRTENSIRTKMWELKLYSQWWENDENKFLKKNYKNMTSGELAEVLNRTEISIRHRLARLGLKQTIIHYKDFNFDSSQELSVFKYIEQNFNTNISKNTMLYYNYQFNEGYVPDFIITEINGQSLKSLIIIEFFGMYIQNVFHKRFDKYKEKADRKADYFNSLSDVIFIPLYPEDCKNKFKRIKEKLLPYMN